jgi:hypothetical protein
MQPEKKHGFPYETPYEEKRRLRLEREHELQHLSTHPSTPTFGAVEPVVNLTPAEQARRQYMACCPVYRDQEPKELTLCQGQEVLSELSAKKNGDM